MREVMNGNSEECIKNHELGNNKRWEGWQFLLAQESIDRRHLKFLKKCNGK